MDKLKYKIIGKLLRVIGFLAILLVAWGIFLPGSMPVEAQSDSDRTAVNENLTIEKGDLIKGDAVVTNGNLTVYGEVRGDVVVAKGNATIQGKVDGNVTVTDGDVELGPQSVVGGNILVLAGKVVRDPSAKVLGNISAPTLSLEGVSNAIVSPIPLQTAGRQNVAATTAAAELSGGLIQLFGKGMISIALLVLGLLLAVVIPTRVSLSSATLEAAPVPALIVGLITAFLLFPIAGLIALVLFISIVGWLFLPVLAVGVCVVMLFGLVSVSAWLGKAVYESVHQGNPMAANHLFAHVLLGMSILLGVTLVPSLLLPGSVTALMLMLLYFASCAGIASAILSRFGTLVPPKHAHQHYHPMPVQGAQTQYGVVAPAGHVVQSPVDTNPAPPAAPGTKAPPTQ